MSSAIFSLRSCAKVLSPLIPCSMRQLQTMAKLRPVPPPTDLISTPSDFLKAIGRSSETKLSFDAWEALWKADGYQLKKLGMPVRDRRYILWCMEKYRSGLAIKDFAHEPKPKKTIRG